MPNPITNFKDSFGTDLGNRLITKEYLMTVYPQIANQLITPELWAWGFNGSGQIGNNDPYTNNNYFITPVTTFAGGTNWKQVATGQSSLNNAAIKTDGTLWTWGENYVGQLGDNTFGSPKITPVTTFAGGTNWKQVAGGQTHIAAIKTDGTLWTWGGNNTGQLGDNTFDYRSTPVTTFAGGTNWKQVAGGESHTVAIKTDGTLWTWGNNSYGQLGDNTIDYKLTPVTTFSGGTNWKQVSCGQKYAVAIKTDGTLWTWGDNFYGALGNNVMGGFMYVTISGTMSTDSSVFYATDLKGLTINNMNNYTYNTSNPIDSDIDNLFLGNFPSDVIDIDTVNKTITFGSSTYIGPGFTGNLNFTQIINTSRSTPVTTFSGGTNWKQVACGGYFTSAIKTDGTLWGWGANSGSQLGLADNTATNRSTPVTTFAGGTNWKQVSCGRDHAAAIKTDGTLWTWGQNANGQLGDNTYDEKLTPVTTFAGGTNWKQVAGGQIHTVAIKTSDDLQGI